MKNHSTTDKQLDDKKALAIEIHNLTHIYQKNREKILALHHINLEIDQGKFVAIVGPNGSGKTTLIKYFNGLFLADHGSNIEIKVLGKRITPDTRSFAQENVGVVFQNPDDQLFFPIVEEDVKFGPRNMNLSEIEQQHRVDSALKLVEALHLKKRITFNLSYGEKKRIAIAGILAMEPEVIVLDEPTAGLDPWIKPKFIDLVTSLKKDKTVICCSHDEMLLKKVDKIIYLSEGKLIASYMSYEDFYDENFGK